MQTKLKLSEIIKTDCYIDCGTNEKLREVVKALPIKPAYLQSMGIYKADFCIRIYNNPLSYLTISAKVTGLPIHHISEIDLNN